MTTHNQCLLTGHCSNRVHHPFTYCLTLQPPEAARCLTVNTSPTSDRTIQPGTIGATNTCRLRRNPDIR